MNSNPYLTPTNVIASLPDPQPNDVSGLTYQAMMAKFDEGLTAFVAWYNTNGATIADISGLIIGQLGNNCVIQSMLSTELQNNAEQAKVYGYKNIGGSL